MPFPCKDLLKFHTKSNGVEFTARDMARWHFLKGMGPPGSPKELHKYLSLKNYIKFTWQEFSTDMRVLENRIIEAPASNRWNPWLERCLMAFTNETHANKHGESVFRSIVLTGAGGCGKTHAAGLYAVAWWLACPENSIAILTSTTIGMVRHRIWPIITHYYKTAAYVGTGELINFGHLIDSQMEIRASKTNAKNAIFTMAVAHGETLKAIDNLKGLHDQRMLLIIDEANGTPEAIFQIIANYRKGCQDLTVIIIGNPCARMDPHGRALTPEDGWGAMNEDMIEWRTRPISEWQLDAGLALRFDGRHSPNVKLGRNDFPYIYTIENWHDAQKHVNTFSYWTQDRGMHPPEGFLNTIFTEQLILRCDALESHFTFGGERLRLAFLDPAFGGDACMLHFAELGDVDGKSCLQLTDFLEVPIDPNASAHDVDYQVARRVQQECIVRRVEPYCFGLDATGIGRGVGALLAAEWSPQIHYMQWGSGATDRPSSQNDGRPAREVYSNYVTELWFSVREAMEAGQLKGLSREAVLQFCSRQYEMSGKKYKAEPKDDMRLRLRFSPDIADAVAGVLEVARRNGLVIAGKIAQVKNDLWTKQVKQAQDDGPLETDQLITVEGGWAGEQIW